MNKVKVSSCLGCCSVETGGEFNRFHRIRIFAFSFSPLGLIIGWIFLVLNAIVLLIVIAGFCFLMFVNCDENQHKKDGMTNSFVDFCKTGKMGKKKFREKVSQKIKFTNNSSFSNYTCIRYIHNGCCLSLLLFMHRGN